MNLRFISKKLVEAKPVFLAISPGAQDALIGDVAKVVKYTMQAYSVIDTMGKPPHEVLGKRIGNKIVTRAVKPVKNAVINTHKSINQEPVELIGDRDSRTWIDHTGQEPLVIVYHDANKAGPHLDIHIGTLSLVYRVKPELQKQLKFNTQGMLTEASKKAIMNYLKSEIVGRSRVPQNLDHTLTDARETWVNGDPTDTAYGSGKTRQIVSESVVEVFKASEDGAIEFYAPMLDPQKPIYVHKLYGGTDKRAPILIMGLKVNHPPKFEDRLHLKLVGPEKLDTLMNKVDAETATAKYDGASCYLVTGPKGTTVWSPRISKRTGEQIEYTSKLAEVRDVKSPQTIVGMGEVLFHRNGEYLPSATIGGILNTKGLMPKDVKYEIRLYRVDKVGRKVTKDLPFWENRKIQEDLANLNPKILKVVELMSPEEAKNKGFEGVVAVKKDGNINNGYKVKWLGDHCDWKIDGVEFRPGDKGGIAGVVKLTSLESGKKFKLGPGQMGTRELCEAMMRDPETFVGSVVKVSNRKGHEGRASKVIGFHSDKGTAPY